MSTPETQSQVPDPTGGHLTLIAGEVRALHNSTLKLQQDMRRDLSAIRTYVGWILFIVILPLIIWALGISFVLETLATTFGGAHTGT